MAQAVKLSNTRGTGKVYYLQNEEKQSTADKDCLINYSCVKAKWQARR